VRALLSAETPLSLTSYQSVISELGRRGHEVVIAIHEEREIGWRDRLLEEIAAPHVTVEAAVSPERDRWLELGTDLRSSVDLARAGFEPLKLVAIREQGMGTNTKLHLQFSSRFWRAQGANGDTFSDTGYQNTWEVTRAQAGKSGILVDYTGGTIGASFGSGTATTRAQQFLAKILQH